MSWFGSNLALWKQMSQKFVGLHLQTEVDTAPPKANGQYPTNAFQSLANPCITTFPVPFGSQGYWKAAFAAFGSLMVL